MFCFILTVFQKVALHSVWKFETVHSNFKHHSSSEQKNILHNMYHRLLSLKTIIFANKCKKQLLRIAGTICKSFQCSRPRRAEEIQRGGAHVFFSWHSFAIRAVWKTPCISRVVTLFSNPLTRYRAVCAIADFNGVWGKSLPLPLLRLRAHYLAVKPCVWGSTVPVSDPFPISTFRQRESGLIFFSADILLFFRV